MVLVQNDYFADAAEIQSLLKIGTDVGSTSYSETDLDNVLIIIQGEVHDFLRTSKLASTIPLTSALQGFYTVKAVITNLLQEWADRRQSNKELAPGNSVMAANIPELSTEMCKRLYRGLHVEDDNADVISLYRGNYHEVV